MRPVAGPTWRIGQYTSNAGLLAGKNERKLKMKAIVTKYHGPTNTKGSRISATDSDNNRVYVSRDCALHIEDSHKDAAIALCKKMNWHGKLVAGDFGPDRRIFVWFTSDSANFFTV
jgi:hypothetical protein